MNGNNKEIDDVDDDLFMSKKPQNYIFADKKANDIVDRTYKSLARTRTLVLESESEGQKTLENLASQRETLERAEMNVDYINSVTRGTQKQLSNMGSFWGGVKSMFSKTPNPPVIIPTGTAPQLPSKISSGPAGASTSSSSSISSSNPASGSLEKIRTATVNVKSRPLEPIEDEFEANLSEIGFGLGRLKEMAMKLGDEIGDQNDMLDRITDKSERAGDSIKHQNRQMQQILKKG